MINYKNGFTLIEVLVVVAIIGVISAVLYGTIGSGIKKGRNTERKAELAKYKLALESFATNNDTFFPVSTSSVRLSQFCSSYLTTYIADCPEDPIYATDNTYVYSYQAQGASPLDAAGTISATRWVLWAKLETYDRFWVSCSNGKSAEVASAGFNVTSANCPL